VMNTSVIKEDLKLLEDQPKYSLFYQLTRITRDRGSLKHDDRLDALAGAVSYWVDSMAKDEDKSVEQHNERLLDEELKVFADHVFNKKFKPESEGYINLGFGRY